MDDEKQKRAEQRKGKDKIDSLKPNIYSNQSHISSRSTTPLSSAFDSDELSNRRGKTRI